MKSKVKMHYKECRTLKCNISNYCLLPDFNINKPTENCFDYGYGKLNFSKIVNTENNLRKFNNFCAGEAEVAEEIDLDL